MDVKILSFKLRGSFLWKTKQSLSGMELQEEEVQKG